MTVEYRVRPAQPADAQAMAQLHVQAWRETYRDTLMRDAALDDPAMQPSRERFWTGALTDERWEAHRIAVAEQDGSLIGIAMSGPVDHEEWSKQLYVLYVLTEHHGSGAGADLLDSVIHEGEGAALWVGDPNPRAQAFYLKHGFSPDGEVKVDDGVRAIRMTRITA